MDTPTVVLFVLGIGLLLVGAEWLVRGAARLAAALGISPLVIGLTVVAFGTSAPELAVSVKSAWAGQPDLALGNVVGSNILNVLLILGASALLTPLAVAGQLVRVDVPLMFGISVVTFLLALDGGIGRLDGALLFGGAVAYTAFQVRQSRKESAEIRDEYAGKYGAGRSSKAVDAALVVAGLALLVLGSRWLVAGAVAFARALGVSELIVGLTIVAAGTSLPEVAASLVAALRGERDIAVGNLVGSNIFNLLTVLGLSALVSPAGLPAPDPLLRFDFPVMVAVALACLPIFANGVIARWEGALFLFYYAAYTAYLVLATSRHDAVASFDAVMGTVVLPLTGVTLAVLGWKRFRAARGRP